MYRIGLAVLACLLLACNGKEDKKTGSNTDETENTGAGFGNRFKAVSLPYQLSDTGLLKYKDTTSLPAEYLSTLVPDSTEKKLFGKTTGVRYSPLAKIEVKNRDAYYVIKGASGSKTAA